MSKLFGNIHLVWRKGQGHRRISIGVIKRNATRGILFEYSEDGVKKAEQQGFSGYPGLSLDKNVHVANIPEIFSKRLLKPERNDVKTYYDFWNISRNNMTDPLHLLAYTQGLLPTDNFEFLADFNPVINQRFITELAGLSHYKVKSDTVNIGDRLKFKKEPDNQNDKYAVAIFHKQKIGYIKIIHSRIFYKSLNKIPLIKVYHTEGGEYINKLFCSVELQ